MTSNNIDQNSLLKYIAFCFGIWGIKYITKDILKKCKDNIQECCHPLTHLLFDLSILEILQFQYTLDQLGIQIDNDQQLMQEFVIAYLSQANCPYLQVYEDKMHTLDFTQSRGLLLIVGWLMAKISFFSKIKTKFIDKKFSALYIQKKNNNTKPKQSQNMQINKNRLQAKDYSNGQSNYQTIQRLYKTLNLHQFRIECLQNKKVQIHTRLSKQLSQYNKKNQTNIRLQNILCDNNNNDDWMQEEQEYLEAVIKEINNGMKNQSYFWMWLQYKIIEPEFKFLENQFQQFQKVQPQTKPDWLRMNPMYLSNYNKQYKSISQRLSDINQYYSTIQPYLDIKPPKNEQSLIKQVNHQTSKLLNQPQNNLVQQLGTPCFLKLQVMKYCEKKGFGSRKRKQKNKKISKQINSAQQQIQKKFRQEVQQFVNKLDQIKFI